MSERTGSNSAMAERIDRATILGLVRCAASNHVQELEWKNEAGRKIHIRLKPPGSLDGDKATKTPSPVTAYLQKVPAPSSGVFERVEAETAASNGRFVKEGQLLGFILIDLLLLPVRASCDGVLNTCGYCQGDAVSSGDLLFKITTTAESRP
jgi:biotin carboxyl carrier protein